jgi:hypothetical protein
VKCRPLTALIRLDQFPCVTASDLFDDANKRTAQAVAERLLGSGATPSQIRFVIDRVAIGEIRSVEDIAPALLER